MIYQQLKSSKIIRAADRMSLTYRRSGKWIVWIVTNIVLLFAEQVAELLAPILVLAGIIWWGLPRIFEVITLDGPSSELLYQICQRVPSEVLVRGNVYRAESLIIGGLCCLVLVATSRTLTTMWAKLLVNHD